MVEISWQPQTATDAVLMCFIRCPGGKPMGGRGEDGLMYVRSPWRTPWFSLVVLIYQKNIPNIYHFFNIIACYFIIIIIILLYIIANYILTYETIFFFLWNSLLNLQIKYILYFIYFVSYLIHQAFMVHKVWYSEYIELIFGDGKNTYILFRGPKWENMCNLVQLLLFI